MRDIIISSWCLWWAVNTIHLRCLFRMNPWSGACGLMLQQSLGHLDATIIYPMAWNRNQSIPAVYIVNWVQRWVTTCARERYGNEPRWRRLCAKNLSMITGWRWIMTVISSMICRADVEYTVQLLKPHSAVRLADISGWGIAMVPVWNPRGTRWLVWTGRSDHQRLNCASAQFSFTGCWKGKFWGKKPASYGGKPHPMGEQWIMKLRGYHLPVYPY